MSAIFRRPATVVAGLSVMLVVVGVGSVGTASAAAPYCGITWGSLAKSGDKASATPLGNVRTGRHECFDRVVFDFDGSANGYRVEYVSELRSDGEGRRPSVAGNAIVRVVLKANSSTSSATCTMPAPAATTWQTFGATRRSVTSFSEGASRARRRSASVSGQACASGCSASPDLAPRVGSCSTSPTAGRCILLPSRPQAQAEGRFPPRSRPSATSTGVPTGDPGLGDALSKSFCDLSRWQLQEGV